MSSDLRQELETLRQACFGPRYQRIRQALERNGSETRKKEFRELEDAFSYLVSHIVSNQQQDGWWNVGQLYQKVITAHAVRHLHKIGISLESRWNLHGSTSETGNLFRATERLIESFHEPKPGRHARWGDDVWDDCYILLALLEAEPDLQGVKVQAWNPRLKNKWEGNYYRSLKWLQAQFDQKGFNEKVASAPWYGPGFYAAAIELFDHPMVKKERAFRSEEHIGTLAAAMKPMLKEKSMRHWDSRFAWHVGQVLVTWNEKRKDYPALKKLNPTMEELLRELQTRQSKSGAWDNRGKVTDVEDQVYYTVRALAACYVNTEEDKFPDSRSIKLTHGFLLDLFRKEPDGLLLNLKASINALEAFQKLFDFEIRSSFPHVLLTLAARLNKLGLIDSILKPLESHSDTLREIQTCARKRREDQGDTGLDLEPVGVNDRLYQYLEEKDEFLNEFTRDRNQLFSDNDREEIRTDLRRFLSATLNETRSKSSRRLIKALWRTDGFLNFIPLIEHLSDLEQNRAFYKYYRDHVNHEVLLFLLGAYIYYNCASFRTPVNDEILQIYEARKIHFERDNLAAEFLFRWKLISTFHDIGYLFEVEPLQDESESRVSSKKKMLEKSFEVVDNFRGAFLFDYFMQYVEASGQNRQNEKKKESAREKEVRHLAKEIANLLRPYPGTIKHYKDVLKLTTVPRNDDAFKLISRYVKSKYIAPDLIRDYFELCRSVSPQELKDGKISRKRPKFYDHGIMSALVLLKATDIQRHYLEELRSKDFSGALEGYPELRNMLMGTKIRDDLDVKQFFIRFSHVAGAIALHNVNPRLYMEQQCKTFDKKNKKTGNGLARAFDERRIGKRGRYIISLDENPLSYLTALADTLQDWDRHSFRRVSFGEESGDPLSSSEVIIDFGDNGQINVRPLTDGAGEKYASMTKREAMDQYLMDWRKYVTIHTTET